jgi:LacI family transcriptional regulator
MRRPAKQDGDGNASRTGSFFGARMKKTLFERPAHHRTGCVAYCAAKEEPLATNRDVARLAGVSISTVSHALNGTRPVSAEKRAAVMAAVSALDYRPSAVARSLTTKVTRTVGVVVADITNPFFAALVRGVENGLADLRYHLIVSNTDERADREAAALRALAERRADGVVIAPTGAPQPGARDLERLGIPVVCIDRRAPDLQGPLVAIDNEAVSARATGHLLALGHRRLGMVARSAALSTVAGRVAGFRRAIAEHDGGASGEVRTSDPTLEAAYAVARRLLDRDDRPTAVLAGNHAMALGVLHALHDLGIACPAEVSVVAFDDHPWAPIFTPPLTVVRVPVGAIVDAACGLLRAAMIGDDRGVTVPADVVLPAELVIRGSTAPPPVRA